MKEKITAVAEERLKELGVFIDNVEYISDLQKKFYKEYISARYDKILVFAYDNVLLQSEGISMN